MGQLGDCYAELCNAVRAGTPWEPSGYHGLSLDGVAVVGDTARFDAGAIRRILSTGKLDRGKSHGGCAGAGTGTNGDDDTTPDPPVIHIRGAWICNSDSTKAEIDLDDLPKDCKIALRLTDCRVDSPLTLRDSGLPWLDLENCVIGALIADRAQLGWVTIKDCRFTGISGRPSLGLCGAKVAHDVHVDGTCFESPLDEPPSDAPGLWVVDMAGAAISGNLSLEAVEIPKPGEHAGNTASRSGVRLTGATVSGRLLMTTGTLFSDSGPALMANYLSVSGDALMGESPERGLQATGAGDQGAVSLVGATITGKLSLTGACLINGSGPALVADQATLKEGVRLDGGFHAEGSARDLAAVGLRGATMTGEVSLEGATVIAHDAGGSAPAVLLTSASIVGRLDVRRATLTSDCGPAVMADYISITGPALLCEAPGPKPPSFTASGAGDAGAVCLLGGTVTGRLGLRGGQLVNRSGPALVADLATIKGDVLLDEGFCATGSIRLSGAGVSGVLSLSKATVTTDAAPRAEDEGAAAAVRLSGSTVGGHLVLRNATLTSRHGPALLADYLTVSSDAFLCERVEQGLTATGAGELGAVCLAGATINGQLTLRGSTLTHGSADADGARGLALFADLVTVKGPVLADRGFVANGAVRLWGATMSGRLRLDGAWIHTAARRDAARPRHGNPGDVAALWMTGATVGDELSMIGTTLASDDGPALVAEDLTVNGDAFIDVTFTPNANGPSPEGANLDWNTDYRWPAAYLDGTNVTKRLDCHMPAPGAGMLRLKHSTVGALELTTAPSRRRALKDERTRHLDSNADLDLEGLTYTGMPTLDRKAPADDANWIDLLARARYSPQPYAALAAAYEAVGNDSAARRILVAGRDDQRVRGGLGPVRRGYELFLKWLIGYGYRSTWAFYWLVGLFILTLLVTIVFANNHYIVAPSSTGTSTSTTATRSANVASSGPCSVAGKFDYALGLAFPPVTVDSSDPKCDVPQTNPNFWVVAFGWVVRALAVLIAGFFLAGLAGLTTRSP